MPADKAPTTAPTTDPTPRQDPPSRLLCGRCGYEVGPLDAARACPECGRAIALSLPERRTGTPWQRREAWGARLATAGLLATGPLRLFDRMRVQPVRHQPVLWAAAAPIALLTATALLRWLEREKPLAGGGSVQWTTGSVAGSAALIAVLAVVLTPVWRVVLGVLTRIEGRGLVFFSRRRGTRVTPALARTIVGHGTLAWLLVGAGALAALPLLWSGQAELALAGFRTPGLARPLAIAGGVLALLGFLAFETTAWLGLRRCRYANPPRPTPIPAPENAPEPAPAQPDPGRQAHPSGRPHPPAD